MASEHTEERPAPLRGYRQLSGDEKATIDRIKLVEAEVGKLWAEVYQRTATTNSKRYALAAEGQFRTGFMELVRAVALPYDPYREALHEATFPAMGSEDCG